MFFYDCFSVDLKEQFFAADVGYDADCRKAVQSSVFGFVPKDIGVFRVFYKYRRCANVFESSTLWYSTTKPYSSRCQGA